MTREFYYQRDTEYAPGRIILLGDQTSRATPRQVDYLLRHTAGFPIAVVEAKSTEKSAETGLERAKEYARDLGVSFAYATNGVKGLVGFPHRWSATTHHYLLQLRR